MLVTFYQGVGKWIFRRPLIIILLSLLLSVMAGTSMRRIQIRTDLKNLLPPNYESVVGLKELEKDLGGAGYLMLAIETNHHQEAISFLTKLATELERLPEVRYMSYRRPTDFFLKHLPFYLDLEDLKEIDRRLKIKKQEMQKGANPLFDALLFSLDDDSDFNDIFSKYENRGALDQPFTDYYQNVEGTLFAALVKPAISNTDLMASRRFVKKVDQIVRRLQNQGYDSIKVSYGGDYKTGIDQEDHLKSQIAKISSAVLLLLMLIIVVYYRRFTPIVIIGGPLLAGILWTGGIVAFWPGHVNLITSFSATILAGLGSDYGIYLLTRYLQERETGLSSKQAYFNTFAQTSRATRGSAITTMVAFAVLALSRFKGMSEFGMIGLIGTFLNLLAMHSFFPALLALIDQKGILNWERRFFPWSPRFHIGRNRLQLAFPVFVLFLAAGLTSLALLGKTWTLEYDSNKFKNTSLESYLVDKKVSTLFSNSLRPEVVTLNGLEEEKKALEAVEQQRKKSWSVPMIKGALGLSSFVPLEQNQKAPVIARIQQTLKGMKFTLTGEKRKFVQSFGSVNPNERITLANLPPEVTQLFKSLPAGKNFVYIFPQQAKDSAEKFKAFGAQIRKIPLEDGRSITAFGDTLIVADMLSLLEREAPWLVGLIFLFCWIDLVFEFRSAKTATFLSGMLAFSLLLFVSGARLFHLRFNFFNLAAPAIIIGTGCDSFIHFYHRYQEHRHRVLETLNVMAPAISIANLTTMVGFGGLIATDNAALRSAGWMVIMGMISVTLTTLFFLPATLTLWKGARSTTF